METKTILGPIKKEKLILCSADASPKAQRKKPGQAACFFPNAPWVGAVRNSAERLGCKFVILTTGHGLVEPDEIINPFDAHIKDCPDEVRKRWEETIPEVLKESVNSIITFLFWWMPKRTIY